MCGGKVSLPEALFEEVLRMTTETTPEAKLGLAEGEPGDVERAALAGARRWTAFANDIGNGVAERRVADTMRRSYTLLWQDARSVASAAS